MAGTLLQALLPLLLCGAGAAAAATGVIWSAPFMSGGGYCSEAISMALALQKEGVPVRAVQHGDSFNPSFVESMPDALARQLQAITQATDVLPGASISVCHSEPGAWEPANYRTSLCPVPGALYNVGRTMFETDRLPSGWVQRLNRMHEVWVPTEFAREIFEAGGVKPSKLHVVPEPVDVEFFDPALADAAAGRALAGVEPGADTTVLLSVFKWEERKGWDVLLEAYLSAQGGGDTLLVLLTNAYHSSDDFEGMVDAFIAERGLARRRIQVLSGATQEELRDLYAGADAFVLPSRGEGWGRPHVEAMSMALPVVATFWSGPTAFMTEANSYPLRIEDELVEIREGAFAGHRWAQPSVSHLRELLREVAADPAGARARGRQARRDMVAKFAPEVVGALLRAHVERIESKLASQGEL